MAPKAKAAKTVRGSAQAWQPVPGPEWPSLLEAQKAAKGWQDPTLPPHVKGRWKSYRRNPGNTYGTIYQCSAHKDCPRLQKVCFVDLACYRRFVANEHSSELNNKRRSNATFTEAQLAYTINAVDNGGTPAAIRNNLTLETGKAMEDAGINPLRAKREAGGLKGKCYHNDSTNAWLMLH